MHNFYQVLEVNSNATLHVIKKVYREKALLEHPDKGGDANRMALLTTAYQTLSDPIKRRQFDKEWEIFNASNDGEFLSDPSGYLPSVGIPFSESFRKQHGEFIHQYRQKPLQKSLTTPYLKPFDSKLYPYSMNGKDELYADIFSFIKQPKKIDSELTVTIKFLTPEKAVECFLSFLKGDYFGDRLRDLSKVFYQKIKQLDILGQQTRHEFQLYHGIYEILLVAVKEKIPTEKLLFSLQKITEYAKHNADQSMVFMAPLLQSKYFRNLYSQALHLYWLSDKQVLEASFLHAFDGQSASEKLIEQLKSKLSENQATDKPSEALTKMLQYARVLFKLEKDLQKRAPIINEDRARFYREKAFHLLDWLPALIGFAEHSIIVNTLLQIGLTLQKAASQASKPTWRMADEKLAAKIYRVAVGMGHHATPDVELYACLHSIKCLLSCHYTDSEFKETLEALQHRALWLADLFPFFQTAQSNADFLSQEDQTLVLMRQLLHALIEKIDTPKNKDEKAIIDHSYVRVFYQAYEACLKNWYQKNHDPEAEKNFRQRLMRELLSSKQWTTVDLDYNLNAPWSLNNLDEQGWTRPKPALPLAKKANVPTYKTVHGVELNYKTGKMAFILDYCQENESDYNRLLTLFDLNELFQRRLTSAIFSLDPVDPDMPYHPFNQMRFAPSTLYHSQLLHTMLLTDYLLKFLTVGQEVQRRDPYDLRSLDEITRQLPDYLKKVINDFHASHHEESLHRFWIESEEMELAVDDEAFNKDGHVLFALGDIKMVVKHHKLTRDAEGNLVDKEGEDEGWDCYVLTKEQKRELDRGRRIIPDSGLIIIKESWELIFWEHHKATLSCTLDKDKHHLIRLSKRQRDDQEKVKIDNSESLRQIYRIVLKAAKKTGMPHRYSPEFIFAQEFTKYYNEFAIHFPEFGRLRELSKAATLVNVMAAQRATNQEEIQLTENRLQDKQHWELEEHHYWQTIEQELKQLIREETTKQFEEWRCKLSKVKLTQQRQKLLNDLRQQIGTLRFTEFSPEIQDICDQNYEAIKRKIIAEHGYAGWNSVSHKVEEEAIKPKIPQLILEVNAQKKTACRQQLLVLFRNEFAGLSSWHPSQLIDKFLEGNDRLLLGQLVRYDRKQVAKQIKEVYPEHTEESLDQALNNSLLNMNEIVDREINKALEDHKQQLKTRLSEQKKLEKSFIDLGFAASAEEIDLKETCLWVPASFRHDVKKGHSRIVYGGVKILGIARHINPTYMQVLANQTRQAGQRLWQNKVWGDAARDYHKSVVQQQYSDPKYTVKTEQYFRTPLGARYPDVNVYSDGKRIHCYEVKTGNAFSSRAQEMKSSWIRGQGCPVDLVRYPACPVNLSNYTNCRVQ